MLKKCINYIHITMKVQSSAFFYLAVKTNKNGYTQDYNGYRRNVITFSMIAAQIIRNNFLE